MPYRPGVRSCSFIRGYLLNGFEQEGQNSCLAPENLLFYCTANNPLRHPHARRHLEGCCKLRMANGIAERGRAVSSPNTAAASKPIKDVKLNIAARNNPNSF